MLNPNLSSYFKFRVQGVPKIFQLNLITFFSYSDLIKLCQFWDTRYVEKQIWLQIRIPHGQISIGANFCQNIPILALKNV